MSVVESTLSSTVDRPPSEPFDETDLRRWPWAIGDVVLEDGLAFVHARHPDGFTVDDVDAIPDDGRRYELLDGVVVVSPSPTRPHQRMVVRLSALLLAAEQGTALTLVAPYDVRLALRRRLQPDVLVLSDAEAAVPVLAVEIVSPSTRRYDRGRKRRAYEEAGIPSYWLLDPELPAVEVLELDADGRYRTAARAGGEEVCAPQLPFPVTFAPAALLR